MRDFVNRIDGIFSSIIECCECGHLIIIDNDNNKCPHCKTKFLIGKK